jgi:hypothetical protein
MSFTFITRELKRCYDYVRNSYHNEFFDFPPRSYSYASPRTPSHVVSHFFPGPNHCSYGFGSRENSFVPKHFGYDPRSHRGNRTSRRHGFPAREFYTRFKLRHLDGPHFLRHGSRPTGSNGEVLKTVKTSSCRMVKWWISKIYLTNPRTEPSTSSRLM